jgi:hypothetical protein
LVPLAIVVVLELYVFPGDWDWRVIVVFVAFAIGLVEVIRAALDLRSDEQSTSTAVSALVGAGLVAVAVYLGRNDDSGWRVMLAAVVVVLSGWAAGHFFPDEEQPEADEEPDSAQRATADQELTRGPRAF